MRQFLLFVSFLENTIPLNRDKEDFVKPKPAMKVKLEDYLD